MSPTYLTDSQWEVMKLLLNDTRKRKYPLRDILNALFYLNRTGCQWPMLPKDFPPFQLCFYYYRKWTVTGLWLKINTLLNRMVRKKKRRKPSPSVGIIDSQSIKNSERGVVDKGFDGNKRIKGRKPHLVVDTLGLILITLVGPANENEGKAAYRVLQQLKKTRYNRMKKILADRGYSNKLAVWAKLVLGWIVEIVTHQKGNPNFEIIPLRSKVERTISWLMWSRRLSRDFECELNSSESQIYIVNIYRGLKHF